MKPFNAEYLLLTINTLQKAIIDRLDDFEREFCTKTDYERYEFNIQLITEPTYDYINFYYDVTIEGADDWTYWWHKKFCDEFGVKLSDYKINFYKSDSGRVDNCFKYRYTSNPVCKELNYHKRLKGFYYYPLSRIKSENDYSCIKGNTRILTHKILKKLRALDNKNIEYDRFVNQYDLKSVIYTLDCLMKQFGVKE